MSKKSSTFAAAFETKHGAIAQLVEQRTENPCVPSSILGGTTERDFRVSFLLLSTFFFRLLTKIFAYMQNYLYLCTRFE